MTEGMTGLPWEHACTVVSKDLTGCCFTPSPRLSCYRRRQVGWLHRIGFQCSLSNTLISVMLHTMMRPNFAGLPSLDTLIMIDFKFLLFEGRCWTRLAQQHLDRRKGCKGEQKVRVCTFSTVLTIHGVLHQSRRQVGASLCSALRRVCLGCEGRCCRTSESWTTSEALGW